MHLPSTVIRRKAYGNATTRSLQINYSRSSFCKSQLQRYCFPDVIFRQKESVSLYNAVNSRDYTNPDDLEIVTLENAIYMGMKNDLAFIIDTNLYLYEHQSTYNPNMPLRDLFYISSEYQKMLDQKSLYSSSLQKIPTPNFIEFYNGSDPVCDVFEHRLSSAFEHLSGEPKLELIVTVLNINEGHNALLMEHLQNIKGICTICCKGAKIHSRHVSERGSGMRC